MSKNRWPLYYLYGVSTIPELVDCAISSLKGKSLAEQFYSQRVKRILKIESEQSPVDATLTSEPLCKEDFLIVLHNCPLSVWSVAHELGHTFEFLSEGIFFPDWRERLLNPEHLKMFAIEIEAFAQAFADRWVSEGNDHQEMQGLLQMNLRESIICFES